MVKWGKKPTGGKCKQPSPETYQKRGRKSVQQHLEPLVQTFMTDIPNSVGGHIYGWEYEILDNIDLEGDMALEDMQTVIIDPGHTRGWTSLFQQFVRTYWLIKCLLAKAVMSIAETKLESPAPGKLQRREDPGMAGSPAPGAGFL